MPYNDITMLEDIWRAVENEDNNQKPQDFGDNFSEVVEIARMFQKTKKTLDTELIRIIRDGTMSTEPLRYIPCDITDEMIKDNIERTSNEVVRKFLCQALLDSDIKGESLVEDTFAYIDDVCSDGTSEDKCEILRLLVPHI
jgi:hypothetical protein